MRNSIFKSYAKKILRSEALVSIIIVFVLAIGIMGTSYALYMDVDTDTDYQVVKVGNLLVSYNNGDNTINLNNVTPTDDEIGSTAKDNVFSFYLLNEGTYTANYDIKLVPDLSITTDSEGNSISANQIPPKYIRFQICKDNAKNCKDIQSLSDYVTVDETGNVIEAKPIYNDEISPIKTNESSEAAYYFIRMWLTSEGYKEENSGYDEAVIGKTIKYKIDIDIKNASGLLDNDNTLAGKLLSDARVKINNSIPEFDTIGDYLKKKNDSGEYEYVLDSDGNKQEPGIYKAEDDYGISYYYRGAQSYNYVNFAGFTWRVVRINGDGSIRLILDGTLDKVIREGESTAAGNVSAYNGDDLDNAYIGYMYGMTAVTTNEDRCLILENNIIINKYGTTGFSTKNECEGQNGKWVDTAYEATHANVKNSILKDEIDSFYENYIEDYKDYLYDSIFCGDKTTSNIKNGISNVFTNNAFSTETTLYGPGERLLYSDQEILVSLNNSAKPTLKCSEGSEYDYSRYTVEKQNIDSVITNGDLKYPIATLSADEAVMAGAYRSDDSINNQTYYLYVPSTTWWTMSAYKYGGGVNIFSISSSMPSSLNINAAWNSDNSVRPVINLKSDILWASGDGTIHTPYEVKLY